MILLPDISDLLGKPFRLLARGPEAFSCMGFVLEVYRRAGLPVIDPQVDDDGAAAQWEEVGQPWEPGDVLVFSRIPEAYGGHVGIYWGGGDVAQAVEKRGVVICGLMDIGQAPVQCLRWKGAA